ncbi:MAG: hypothetical protein K6T68_07965, partial [Alicyclobacillus shizuokensis]|nr:hypothetical protein [Alicyclobacillus shizuokensis]
LYSWENKVGQKAGGKGLWDKGSPFTLSPSPWPGSGLYSRWSRCLFWIAGDYYLATIRIA